MRARGLCRMRARERARISAIRFLLCKISPFRDLLAYDLLNSQSQQSPRIALIVWVDFRLIEIVFTLQSLFSLSPQQAILCILLQLLNALQDHDQSAEPGNPSLGYR
ncbi:MAG TPA: hypothetical protein VN203_17965 [Candidatus Acidoferrum sp.]|nr:hypothetical protein [Candidatus Acidoferrum sp.]